MKAQHERIDLLEKDRCQLWCDAKREKCMLLLAEADKKLGIVGNDWETFCLDAAAQEAFRLASDCLTTTGDFAALDVTSAVPFVGKRGMVKEYDDPYTVVYKNGDYCWWCVEDGTGKAIVWIEPARLLPLEPPATKHRPPATNDELKSWFGVSVTGRDGKAREITGINRGYAELSGCGWVTWQSLCANYTRTDNGQPVGVLVEE